MYIENEGGSKRLTKNNFKKSFSSDSEYLISLKNDSKKYPLFSQVLLETRTDCNRKCTFCPQYHLERPLKLMDWAVFTKVIDNLAIIEFSGRIALFMTNEPLLENRIIDMIKYARSKSPRFFLDITTNGTLLTIDYLDQLLAAGIDNVNINDYRSDRISNPDKISKKLLDLVNKFNHNPKVTYNKRSTKEVLSNYAGTIENSKRQLKNGFCNYPFRKLAISADGNILLCCNDYEYSTSFGNVMENNVEDIWFSSKMNKYRDELLKENRIGICSNCDEFQDYNVFI